MNCGLVWRSIVPKSVAFTVSVEFHFTVVYDSLVSVSTISFMPKVHPDEALQRRLNEFFQRSAIGIDEFARTYSLSRVSVWRFRKSGLARPDLRSAYAAALDNATATQSQHIVSGIERPFQLSKQDELDVLAVRRACETVLKLLDVYEGRTGEPAAQGR